MSDMEPKIRRLDPMGDKEKELTFGTNIEYLTLEQILEMYGEKLTADEINHLIKSVFSHDSQKSEENS